MFGAGNLLPKAAQDLGRYGIECDVVRDAVVDCCDKDFSIFAAQSVDFAFLGKRLDIMPNPQETIRDAASKIRIGGHLTIHVTKESIAEGAFPFTVGNMTAMVGKAGAWQAKDCYERNGEILATFKRLPGAKGVSSKRLQPGPRALICRYGALGDSIQLTPMIRALHEDGYKVTMNITPYAAGLLEHNPFISNVIIQEKDAIPNPDLGGYWEEWKGDYDRVINLSESIEGRLLFVEGRKEFYTSKAFRNKVANKNYHDFHMELAGYSHRSNLRPELFFTKAEERTMQKLFSHWHGKFVILWAINGSSHHKVYPLMEPVMRDWLDRNPDAVLVTLGDKQAKLAEFEHPQVVKAADEWSVREVALATKYASVVVGPETFLLNAASCFNTPKITFLSHSAHHNLCSHWTNDYCLEPDPAMAPCFPCNMLHYLKDSCPQTSIFDGEQLLTTGPTCAMGAISGERVQARLDEVKRKHFGKPSYERGVAL